MGDKCTSLEEILNKYDATPWVSLSRYIDALTGTAVGLFILSVGALTVPRRLAPRAFLATLLFFQILILIPYFILDSRRNSMILKNLGGEDALKRTAAECKLSGRIRGEVNFYRFQGNGRSGWFEGFALIASSCISGVLASRLVYLSVLSSFNGDVPEDGFGRGRRHARRASQRDFADIDALLLELRLNGSTPSAPPAPGEGVQCAICLDEIILNAPKTMEEDNNGSGDGLENGSSNISQLHCSHMYHENCLRNWFRSTSARNYSCPMCKASVWADGDDGEQVEQGDADEESGVGRTSEARGDIEAGSPVEIEIEVAAPASSRAAPEMEIVALTSTAAEASMTCAQHQQLESDDFVVIPLPREGPQP